MAALAAAWLTGCGAGPSAPVQPGAAAQTPPTADPATPSAGSATPPAADPAAPPPSAADPIDPRGLVGWWRGPGVCLELFANGDFELSLPTDEPKVMAMGAATLTPTGDAVELKLTTARIWKARFTGPCRKVHELGDWIDAQDILGAPFKPGETSTLTLRRTADDQVELCGARCQTLRRETPQLVARWRRERLTFPDRPEAPWSAGDLLELALDDQLGHVWLGGAGGKFSTLYGRTVARHVGPDRFVVEFTGERYADDPPAPQTGVGLPFGPGQRTTLAVRRLAGERLEVCGAEGRCATLEREFDAYHHDLD